MANLTAAHLVAGCAALPACSPRAAAHDSTNKVLGAAREAPAQRWPCARPRRTSQEGLLRLTGRLYPAPHPMAVSCTYASFLRYFDHGAIKQHMLHIGPYFTPPLFCLIHAYRLADHVTSSKQPVLITDLIW